MRMCCGSEHECACCVCFCVFLFLFQGVCMTLCLCVCASVCLFVCMSLCLCVCLYVYIYMYCYVYMSISPCVLNRNISILWRAKKQPLPQAPSSFTLWKKEIFYPTCLPQKFTFIDKKQKQREWRWIKILFKVYIFTEMKTNF